ncbi:hypothetical protein DNHGIG_22960 [Collibacillus ludicampi]|uniref:DUF6306 domain-containing protein n=1 Tax=Collibacillus ludicampi TaxID=2771369 RepID=A0AAV4LG22_9BACL|nr:DUF6306 domain-containing protein [Collibacillus ludicampi]GIM46747.1 hypothetical protein DNHGIG_22960 [Collibacillus ludicampi]
MREAVGRCIRCTKEVYCSDGFLHGIVLDSSHILCFTCRENDELIHILNQLLEAEKAGVETLDYLLRIYPSTVYEERMKDIKKDEAWSCSGLIEAVRREGGTPSKKTGTFLEKVKAQPSFEDKISLLNKGQAWVARKINDALSFGMHEETRSFLLEMKQRHVKNIQAMSV